VRTTADAAPEDRAREGAAHCLYQAPTIRPSFFAYTEGQSDAQNERNFIAGAELCLLEFSDGQPSVRTLLADPKGAIRDPAVSWTAGGYCSHGRSH